MAVVKWQFLDIWGYKRAVQQGISTDPYVHEWEINPNEGGSPQSEKNYNVLTNTGPRQGIVVQEGRMSTPTIEFSGVILTQEQFENMDEWYRKRVYLRIKDDLGRIFRGSLATWSPQRVRRPNNPWYHTYTASFNIVQATKAPDINGDREVIYGRTYDSESTVRVRNAYTWGARADAPSILLQRPPDVVEGDILICSMINVNIRVTPDGKPKGWKGAGSTNIEGFRDHRIFWKRATANEPKAYRWYFDGSHKAQAVIIAVANAQSPSNGDEPFIAKEHKEANYASSQLVPSLSFNENDSILIAFGVFITPTAQPPIITPPDNPTIPPPLATIQAAYMEQYSQVVVVAPYFAGGPTHSFLIDWQGTDNLQTSAVALTRDTSGA